MASTRGEHLTIEVEVVVSEVAQKEQVLFFEAKKSQDTMEGF